MTSFRNDVTMREDDDAAVPLLLVLADDCEVLAVESTLEIVLTCFPGDGIVIVSE